MFNAKKSVGGRSSSTSRLPVRQSTASQETRESRSTRCETNIPSRTRASSTSRSSNCLSVERPSLRRTRSSASIARTPQHTELQVPGNSRNRPTERKRILSTERLKNLKRDARPINDKKWQAEALAKTQQYFQSKPEAVAILNKGTYLRPMTIKLFVQLVNLVLQDIEPEIDEITTSNYVELLPDILSMLMYPLQMSPSALKTVNTMHSWPQVLAVLSWLTEVKVFIENIPPINQISADAAPDVILHSLGMQTVMKTFERWNVQEPADDLIAEYEENARKMLDTDASSVERAKNLEKQALTQLQAKEQELYEKRKILDKKTIDLQTLKNDCKNSEDGVKRQIEYSKYLASSVKDTDDIIAKLQQELEAVNLRNEKLAKQIKEQPASKVEREKILEEIEDLKRQEQLQIEKQLHKEKLSDEYDIQISQLKRELEQKVNKFNIALLKPSLEHPELKELTLPESGFLQGDIVQVFEEKERKKQEMLAILDGKIKDRKAELKEWDNKIIELQRSIDKITAKGLQDKAAINQKKQEFAKLKEDSEKEKTKLLTKIENMKKLNIETSNSITDLKEKEKELRKYMELNEWWEKKIEREQKQGVIFFKTIKENVEKTIPLYQEIMNRVSQAAHETITYLENPVRKEDV